MARNIDTSEGFAALTEDELLYLRDRNRITDEEFDEAMSEEYVADESDDSGGGDDEDEDDED